MRWGTVGGRVEHAWAFDGRPIAYPDRDHVPRFHHYGETYRSLCRRRLETSDAIRSCLHQGPGGVEFTEEAPAERCAACAREEAETASFIEVAWHARVERKTFEKLINDVRFVSGKTDTEKIWDPLHVWLKNRDVRFKLVKLSKLLMTGLKKVQDMIPTYAMKRYKIAKLEKCLEALLVELDRQIETKAKAA